jgi:hypothetical protein
MMSPVGLRRYAGIALSACLLSVGSPRPAFAQSDSATARALFSEGRKLMGEKRYEDACPKFEESLRLDQGMGTQFNLAFCWEQLGRTASAWALFLDVAASARAVNQPERESAARERAAALEPKLSRLTIRVPASTEGLELTRDGVSVGRAVWGTAVPVDPGTHVLSASAPGKQSWKQQVSVASAAARVSVDVPALADAPEEAAPVVAASSSVAKRTHEPASTESEPERDHGGNGQKVAAWVVGGVGVAAVAAGTFFALRFRSERNKADAICVDRPMDCSVAETQEYVDHKDNALSARTGVYVGFGIGGAALVTSAILFITASSSSESDASLEVAPLVGSDSWGAALSGRF